jgi:hypothetical protein
VGVVDQAVEDGVGVGGICYDLGRDPMQARRAG